MQPIPYIDFVVSIYIFLREAYRQKWAEKIWNEDIFFLFDSNYLSYEVISVIQYLLSYYISHYK